MKRRWNISNKVSSNKTENTKSVGRGKKQKLSWKQLWLMLWSTKGTIKRLQADERLLEQYKTMRDIIHYLLHHEVIAPHKLITKPPLTSKCISSAHIISYEYRRSLVETTILCEEETVLVNEPDVPCGKWKLVRIKEIEKGEGAEASNDIIEMPLGRFRIRPINALCFLETDVSN
ncbi:unnamed protein product [Onchocerca ochengi]|uniref:DUF5641 domain-containing protein n=1 Tax=Onchocerca ochengi TaxID=42157 RepID=A0A182E4P0_ONCOC|nr:unnamed protein product [Onchocerca ochengi]